MNRIAIATVILVLGVLAAHAVEPPAAGVHEMQLPTGDDRILRYSLSVPRLEPGNKAPLA